MIVIFHLISHKNLKGQGSTKSDEKNSGGTVIYVLAKFLYFMFLNFMVS